MISGLQVLNTIDQTVLQAKRDADVIDREVGDLTEHLVRLRAEQGRAYRELAKLRLQEITSGTLVGSLTSAEEQARALLTRRSAEVKAIDERLVRIDRDRMSIDAQRMPIIATCEQLREELDNAERQARKAFTATEPYQKQLAATAEADRVARYSEQKAELAEKDRVEKGKPYEADELFMYLWNRGHDTPDGVASGLARMFDRRVGRLIEYDKARADYVMLQEIPRRLAEYAARMRAEAEAEASKLEQLVTAELEKGALGEQRSKLALAQKQLDALEEKVEAVEQQRTEVLAQRAKLTGGEDAPTRQAIDLIEAAIRQKDLAILREEAGRTPRKEDDALVAQIEAVEQEIARVGKALASRKSIQRAQQTRMSNIDSVRREYRQRGYGADAWSFRDGSLVSLMLMELLRGSMSRDGFWDSMQRHRVPTGLPGLGLPVPGWPGGQAGGGFSIPRTPSGDSGGGFTDGFRTGGSF
jgi:hypothetical protein